MSWAKPLMSRVLVLAIVSFAWGTAAAQRHSDGRALHELEWAKSKDDFKASLILTNDPETFFESWGSGKGAVQLSSTDRTRKGRSVEMIVIFAGCSADADGLCRVTSDFVILKPDGSIYAEVENREVWLGKLPPPAGAIQFGIDTLGLVVEPQDPLGKYELQVTVRDKVAGEALHLQRELFVESPHE